MTARQICLLCAAPGFLATEPDLVVIVGALASFPWHREIAISGNTLIAAPLVNSSRQASTALGLRREPHHHDQGALATASARACARVRWPRRAMSRSAL